MVNMKSIAFLLYQHTCQSWLEAFFSKCLALEFPFLIWNTERKGILLCTQLSHQFWYGRTWFNIQFYSALIPSSSNMSLQINWRDRLVITLQNKLEFCKVKVFARVRFQTTFFEKGSNYSWSMYQITGLIHPRTLNVFCYL